PFYKKHGYKGKILNSQEYILKNPSYPAIKILYTFSPHNYSFKTEIWKKAAERNGNNIFAPLNFIDLIDGPEQFQKHFRASEWYFETDEEVLGIFEKQADVLEEWLFDWMHDKLNLDINFFEINGKNAKKRRERRQQANDNEKKRIDQEYLELSNKWRTARFYPKNWQ
ncbi:MAG: hypothetical protein MJB14_06360, partial [Spirochaetes bacterium]|nr:hypothetical protein [Spirochaetota bacterium]